MDELNHQDNFTALDLPEDKLWDDSLIISRKESLLPDGRLLKSELWGEYGYTFLTYTFPKTGLETAGTDEIVNYLATQGILIDPVKFPMASIDLMTSNIDPDLYSLTLTIAEEED